MDWETANALCEQLDQRHQTGQDVGEELHQLYQQVAELNRTVAPLDEQRARTLPLKAEAIRRHLSLGAIELPEHACQRLAEFADSLTVRVLSRDLLEQINSYLKSYVGGAESAQEQVATLTEQRSRLGVQLDLLRSYLAIADALVGTRDSGSEQHDNSTDRRVSP